MSTFSRRRLLRGSGALLGAAGIAAPLLSLFGRASAAAEGPGYGPLLPDPRGYLDLPRGFRYEILSRTGESMNDGRRVPGLHDGMAAFPAGNGNTILVRNHELAPDAVALSPYPGPSEHPARAYDPAAIGGTTTLEVDPEGRLVRHFLSLAGTVRNCGGGPTPWGTWISCEETVGTAGTLYAPAGRPERGVRVTRTHGYNFEVPARGDGLADAVPLREMGRFNHEAAAVDPRTGYVYQTEDRPDGAIYRFRPRVRGRLALGGDLEALRFVSPALHSTDTHNLSNAPVRIPVRRRYPVEWVPILDPDPRTDSVRHEAWYRGAATFARGEGIYWSRGSLYVACTSGGPAGRGQIWRLRPGIGGRPDELELFVEVGPDAPLKSPDNLCASPTGELIVCEDGPGDQFVVGISPAGQLYRVARNALNRSEFAGAAFSPDGRILFVNIQSPGITYAILGPWT